MTYTPEAHNGFLWTVIGSPWGLLAIWLVLINLVTFFVFGYDKWKAKYKEKHEVIAGVPEGKISAIVAQISYNIKRN